jgi:hypothetical protein
MNLRLLALTGVAVCALALPLAVASAGPVGDQGRSAVRTAAGAPARDAVRDPARHAAGDAAHDAVRDAARDDDKVPSSEPTFTHPRPRSRGVAPGPHLLGLGLATAAHCGPELSSPDGIEAQTCVLTQGEDTWARTYYRNATGRALDSVLSLMGPGGRTVQMHCAVAAEDEPGTCETPRERTRGNMDAYTAVAEFAAQAGGGPLLLRSGSNSQAHTGS